MNQTQTVFTPTKFQNSEQMWFWFLCSTSRRNNIGRRNDTSYSNKICEAIDIETLITKLYLAGKFTNEELLIMKEYGDKKRAPHQYIWRENHAAAVWGTAMKTLDEAARAKGWIE